MTLEELLAKVLEEEREQFISRHHFLREAERARERPRLRRPPQVVTPIQRGGRDRAIRHRRAA